MKINSEFLSICGDIHGEFRKLIFEIERRKIENSDIIIAGDVGLGFYKDGYYLDEFRKISRRLRLSNNHLIFMRGNHDNPELFNVVPEKYQTKQITIIPDYTILEWNDQNILCVGGAISVDRTNRTNRIDRKGLVTYWEDEYFKLEPEKIKSFRGIDYVITHSAPDFCFPYTKGSIFNEYLLQDKNLEIDCQFERNNHTWMYNELIKNNNIKEWHYGHFHMTNTEIVNDTKFVLHDIMEIREIR